MTISQRNFVLSLSERALAESESSLAPQDAPENAEEAPEDNGSTSNRQLRPR